ncbi:MAG: hypothetical protein J2P33_16825 [Actinobacteria bacterium]|nr:hypothetical protein [Actinomycetota bacterium]
MTSPATLLRTLRDRLAAAGRLVTVVPGTTGTGDRQQGWFERVFVPAIVVIFGVGEPLILLGRVLANPHRPSAAVAAGLGAACSVPLGLWLLLPAARGRPARLAGWLIVAFAAINLAVNAVVGAWWLGWVETLSLLAAVYLRPRWSVPAVAALGAVPATMVATGHDAVQAQFYTQSIVGIPLFLGPLIWLTRAAARLRAGRQELADSAVIAERVRIDDELGVSIGAELERLIAAGEHAARTAADDPAAAEREVRRLTGASRAALAQTRRMVSRYRAVTVRSEITTAVALLAAAGIGGRADVPAAVLDRELDGRRLAGFRSSLTGLLRDDAVSGCVITADGSDGDVRLEIRREQRVPT